MKEIPLTQGQVALVDDCDFDELNRYKWYATKAVRTFYAIRKTYVEGIRRNISMHRQILASECANKLVDHANGIGTDNRRENLRVCSASENVRNSRKCITPASSKFKGVSWNKVAQKWEARIKAEESHCLGSFDLEEEAARAYDAAAREHFGEFACLNFT